jgi:hypothetical protein
VLDMSILTPLSYPVGLHGQEADFNIYREDQTAPEATARDS